MNRTSPLRVTWVCAVVSVLLMAGISVWAFRTVPYSADEYAYLYQAQTYLEGRVINPPTPDPQSFKQAHILQTAAGTFSKYPPAWPAVLAPWVAVQLGFLINPILLGAVLLLGFRLARRVAGPRTAMVFVLLLSSNAFFLLNGTGLFSHPLSTLTWLAALEFGFRYAESARRRDALALGLCGAVIFLARPQDALFLTPSLLLLAGVVLRTNRQAFSVSRLSMLLLPLVAAGLVFLVYNRETTGDFWLPGHVAANPDDHPTLNLVESFRRLGDRVLEYVQIASVSLLGLMWLGLHGRRPTRTVVLVALTCGLFVVSYSAYTIVDGVPQFGPRYWLPMHPLLVFLAAWAITRATRRRWLTPLLAVIVIAQLGQTGAIAYSAQFDLRAVDDLRRAAELLTETAAPERPWIAVTTNVGAIPPQDLVRNPPADQTGPVLVRGDRTLPPTDHPIFVYEGTGGPMFLRALDPTHELQGVLMTHPPRVLGLVDRPGWLTTTGSNRAAKRIYAYPGSRLQDWTAYVTRGPITVSADAPPQEGLWNEVDRSWFVRHYRTQLRILTAGVYTFSVAADDEAQLWIDGRDVLHARSGMERPPSTVQLSLEPGLHPLLLAYSNVADPARLTFTVQDARGVRLPAEQFLTWSER